MQPAGHAKSADCNQILNTIFGFLFFMWTQECGERLEEKRCSQTWSDSKQRQKVIMTLQLSAL